MPNDFADIQAVSLRQQGALSTQSGYLDRLATAAESWALDVENELKMAAPTRTGTLFNSIKRRIRYRDGFPVSISFNMRRYGVYIEKGAGRGYGGQRGSSWYYEGKSVKKIKKYGGKSLSQKRVTDRSSLSKQGKGNRPARPFFNPTVEANINKLADSVTNEYADLVVKFIGIK